MTDDPQRCIHRVFASPHERQCSRKRGYGENKQYCKQHAQYVVRHARITKILAELNNEMRQERQRDEVSARILLTTIAPHVADDPMRIDAVVKAFDKVRERDYKMRITRENRGHL